MTKAPTPTRTTAPVTRPAAAESAVQDRGHRLLPAAGAVGGGLLGLLPHVLHHVTFLAGTALIAGSGGTALFAALGLAASVPLLLRLYRKSRTWRAPAIGLAVFVAMFALSAFVIGPAIGNTSSGGGSSPTVIDHTSHHH